LPVRFCHDESPADGSAGVIAAFITGTDARNWVDRSTGDRRQAVLANLASFFGARALAPLGYSDLAWAAEPWTRGGFGGFTTPGGLVDCGPAIGAPDGLIHWTGAEAATRWTGRMDGAVSAGRSTANEVLDAI
jgi:monoamine oxidase